ncbi:MAG: TlyA family RNA methyltransferase [Myxococcota bacterium]
MKKARADELLAASKEVANQVEAQGLIMSGRVLWTDLRGSERKVESAGQALPIEARFRIKGRRPRFVSRGGEKLEAALAGFGVEVHGTKAIDLGISTGGFTDCLLQHGAREVWGVDVGYGLVADALRRDPRVRLLERTHVATLTPKSIEGPADLVVGDLSFISLQRVLPVLVPLVVSGGPLILLVKPQFEVEARHLEAGIVTEPEVRLAALDNIRHSAEGLGFQVLNAMESPVHGAKGNIEWLMFARRAE